MNEANCDRVSDAGIAASGDQAGSTLRETFSTFELATVLSHFDIGTIQTIKTYPRGSRKSPKVLCRTDSGRYLLKRRAEGKDDPFKVAFCHQLQLTLADRHFPLPRLIGTRQANNSMLQLNDATYELFEYIRGEPYDTSPDATADAGRVLALFHKLLVDYESPYRPSEGSYHGSRAVAKAVDRLPEAMDRLFGPSRDHGEMAAWVKHRYDTSRQRVAELGFDQWPSQVIHSDWHPGNILFHGSRVVAVIDYDASRIQQRVLDVANGLLQFSIVGGAGPASKWPEGLDLVRYRCFFRAYEDNESAALSQAELKAIPHLMIEALITECVIPIAVTGSFGRSDGRQFLAMVRKKASWIDRHEAALAAALEP